MQKFIIVDTSNMFFRVRHIASKFSTPDEKVAFAMHLLMQSIAKCWKDFSNSGHNSHVVIALEGRSWRKDFYEPYKKNRAAVRSAYTEKEQEEDRLYWEGYEALTKYIEDKTNCTILRHPEAEADDMIARWIHSHPDAEHVIVSSDSDYYQLINSNVSQYNGVTDEHITMLGIFDAKGKIIMDKKTKEPKMIGDPEWLLFEKCMRGDTSDNVFSAYPGAPKKSSKNRVGLIEAFSDRHAQGFAWNTVMLTKWIDHNQVQHRVLDDYQRNKTLIDLSAQPDEFKMKFDTTIKEQAVTKSNAAVGTNFLKFCGKHDLVRLAEQSTIFANLLSSPYHV
jgi:5'-3' exonuclease